MKRIASQLGILAVIGALLPAAMQAAARTDSESWNVLPVYGGGFVQNVIIAPSDKQIWYAYVDVGGPYRSNDGGRTWRSLHGGFPLAMRDVCADHVRGISVDPCDADTFAMVSGDSFDNPAGAYITHDGGRTFRRTLKARFYGDGGRRWTGNCIARNPVAPHVILCGEDYDGLFKSVDGGETWRNVGLAKTWITDIHWDLRSKQTVYVCSPDISVVVDGHVQSWNPRERRVGLYRSDDSGDSWALLKGESPSEIAQMAVSDRILGLFESRNIRCSDDHGLTWSSFEEGLPIRPAKDVAPQCLDRDHYQALAAGPDFWLVGNSRGDIYRRGKDDSEWRQIECERMELSDPTAEHHMQRRAEKREKWSLSTINIDEENPDHWLATDWFEIWETFDAGRSWRSRVVGMSQLCPFVVSCSPHSHEDILYGMADMGMSCSHDGGLTFHAVRQTGGANSIAWCRHAANVVFAVGGKSGIQFVRSRDSGRTWDYPRRKGLPPFRAGACRYSESDYAAYTVAVDPTTDNVFLALSGLSGDTGGGVWVSSDFGDSFSRFSKGLPDGKNLFKRLEFDGGGSSGWTPELVFGEDGSAVLSTWDGMCYYLDREDDMWRPTAITNKSCSCTIAADPFRKGRFLFANGRCLSESLDGGKTWRELMHGADVGMCVAFDRFSKGLVVMPSHDKILISYDGGQSFPSELPRGLDFPTGNKRWVVVDRKRLFGLTRGSGVWKRLLSGAPAAKERIP